jgi:hypothetical protein
VTETRYDCTDELDFDHLVGGVYSALSARRLPPSAQRTAFAAQIHRAVAAPHAPFIEHVPVRMLLGRAVTPGCPVTTYFPFCQRRLLNRVTWGFADCRPGRWRWPPDIEDSSPHVSLDRAIFDDTGHRQSQRTPAHLRPDPAAVSANLAYSQLTRRSSDGKLRPDKDARRGYRGGAAVP